MSEQPATAKQIRIEPISSGDAMTMVRRLHYSGRVAQNSQLHLGAFLNGKLEGVMQFGPSMDKRKMLHLVRGTKWNGFLELNRMAFSERLPRNSESRALGVAMRMIRRSYPHIDWIVSFADASQCGDGTIYRASGFLLTGIKRNRTQLLMPDGTVTADLTLNVSGRRDGRTSGWWRKHGAVSLDGFQLRYMYFLNPEARARLTVPVLPFAAIERAGAGMYRGKQSKRVKQAMAGDQPEQRRCDSDPPAPQSEVA